MGTETDRERLAVAVRRQGDACGRLGSTLYEQLLHVAASDLEAGGPVWRAMSGCRGDPDRSAVALRMMGSVHHLVLDGRAPLLAAHYPSTGGTPGPDVGAAFLATVEAGIAEIRRDLERELQTNEVGRCAALLGGFLALGWTGRPFRLLEIGSSAGLNLWLDRYRYELGVGVWGPPGAPVTITSEWSGPAPALGRRVHIARRAGCDVTPIDLTDPDARLRLESFVWPDQPERLGRARRAFAHGAASPPPVVAAAAEEWLPARLGEEAALPTVVMHSVMWQYLGDEAQRTIEVAIDEAGRRASPDVPFARVALEPGPDGFVVSVTEWPGGARRTLATSHPHGSWVRFGD